MRWRPLTRPLILIALLLLAGAVVNVAVAWVLVGAPDSWTPGGAELMAERSTESVAAERMRRSRANLGAPLNPHHVHLVVGYRGAGWEWFSESHDDANIGWWNSTRLEAGWPSRSMCVTGTILTSPRRWWYSLSLEMPQALLRGTSTENRRDRIPLTPIPPGFAINTLFYAAVLGLPLSFFPIRRRLRARRGRCTKCGYDRAGLADPAAPCPECGAVR